MKWAAFEDDIAATFQAMGYKIEKDVLVGSRQIDIMAVSTNRLRSIIMIECKYHEQPIYKVNPDDIEKFKNKVVNLRNEGLIDCGFLITNTGFTKTAKESVQKYRYIHLCTSADLFEELLDTKYYLNSFIENYEKENRLNKFIDLWVADASITSEIRFDYSFLTRSSDQSFDMIEKALSVNEGELESEILDNIYFTETFIKKFSDKVSEFLRGSNQMQLILGDFGSGKSTCLNHLMYILAKKKISTENTKIPIPLLINLKEFCKTPDFDSLYVSFFQRELGNSNINLPIFKKLNEQGYFILLFDGFDEMAMHVDKKERKYTFMEICKQLTTKNKILLSGRPAYFPDNDEMLEILRTNIQSSDRNGYYLWKTGNKYAIPKKLRMFCLQLMDDIQIHEYFKKNFSEIYRTSEGILNNSNIKDLARRPVLANMIIDSAENLKNVPPNEINLCKIYDIYTDKWINREEQKGRFRILIDSVQKRFFLSSLASQMYLNHETEIHYSKLNERIQMYFELKTSDQVDYFSHDIRTCSFLHWDDNFGNYKFIHRSFMEYFVAVEFMRFEPTNEIRLLFREFSDDIVKFIETKENSPKGFVILFDTLKWAKELLTCYIPDEELVSQLKNLRNELVRKIDALYPFYNDVPSYADKRNDIEKRINELKKGKKR